MRPLFVKWQKSVYHLVFPQQISLRPFSAMEEQLGEVSDPYLSEYGGKFEDILLESEELPHLPPDQGAKQEDISLPKTESKFGRVPTTCSKHGGPPGPQQAMPKALAKATSRAPKLPRSRVPWEIRYWGPLGYYPADRGAFCAEYRSDPDALRRKIEQTAKAHPGYTNKQFNRLLYDTYGARVRELNLLLDCNGMTQLINSIFSYDEPSEELKGFLEGINFGRQAHREKLSKQWDVSFCWIIRL